MGGPCRRAKIMRVGRHECRLPTKPKPMVPGDYSRRTSARTVAAVQARIERIYTPGVHAEIDLTLDQLAVNLGMIEETTAERAAREMHEFRRFFGEGGGDAQ